MMNRKRTPHLLAGLLAVCAAGAAHAQVEGQTEEQKPPAPPAAKVETDARQALDEMVKALTSERQLVVTVTRRLDPALVPGAEVAENAKIEVQVRRPDKLHATIRAGDDVRQIYYDGKTVTVYDQTKNMYAQAPIEGTIDDMVRHVEQRFGFVPPVAEMVTNDPQSFLRDQVKGARVGKTETIGGKTCQQLDITGDFAEANLWVAQDGRLPCRLEATFTDVEGQPQLRVDFEEWRLGADVPDSTFVFEPPPGAQKIEMKPIEPETGGT